jgi:HlyD family secretion protein
MRLPRPRFTIMGLMILVVIASLVMTGIVLRIERNRRVAALQVAWAEYENAKLTREMAEIAVEAFTEGVFKHDFLEAEDEIRLAKMYLDYAVSFLDSDEQTVGEACKMLAKAQNKKVKIGTYTTNLTIDELKTEVAKAKAAERAATAAFDQLTAAVANAWW